MMHSFASDAVANCNLVESSWRRILFAFSWYSISRYLYTTGSPEYVSLNSSFNSAKNVLLAGFFRKLLNVKSSEDTSLSIKSLAVFIQSLALS